MISKLFVITFKKEENTTGRLFLVLFLGVRENKKAHPINQMSF
jgi:hypothetical protein